MYLRVKILVELFEITIWNHGLKESVRKPGEAITFLPRPHNVVKHTLLSIMWLQDTNSQIIKLAQDLCILFEFAHSSLQWQYVINKLYP